MRQKKGFSVSYWIGIFILIWVIALIFFLGRHGWDMKAAVSDMLSIFRK